MKRCILTLVAVLTLSLAVAGSARAVDYPEQPNGHVQTACTKVAANPGFATAPLVRSATANTITDALFVDACLGG
jgi:hypothetical protein